MVMLLVGAGASPARGQGAGEYQVKAAFLFHFIQLVEWPADAAPPGSLNLCVIAAQADLDTIRNTVDGKSAGSREVHVVALRRTEDAFKCNLLFVSGHQERQQQALLGTLRGHPVLTVGEDARFLSDGGIIRFRLQGDHVRFDINLLAADEAHLRVSSRLLLLATSVIRSSAQRPGGI